jgi:beta-N-acetylhexosaminidase
VGGDKVDTYPGWHLVIGFEGTKPSAELLSFIREEKIGGIVLFRRNWESLGQFKYLISKLTEAGEGELFVCIDHEGGRVHRLSKPFTHFPPQAVLAGAEDGTVFNIGKAMAAELSAVGINVNFAPVLDIATNPFNPVIGDRAFGPDPEKVSNLGILMIQGMLEGNVMPCGKHFPGHGDTNLDSHLSLPVLPHTKKRLEACELLPFRKAIAADVPSIMTAHILVPNIDSLWPASISRSITYGLLRRQMNFEGLIFTDDLLMKGISSQMTYEEAASRALNAGADIILICNDISVQRSVLDSIKKAMDRGTLIDLSESRMRIRRAKGRFCSASLNHPPLSVIGCKEHAFLVKKLTAV